MNSTEPRKTIIDFIKQYSMGSKKFSELLTDEQDEEVRNLFYSDWQRAYANIFAKAKEELKNDEERQ